MAVLDGLVTPFVGRTLDLKGLNLPEGDLRQLLELDLAAWHSEIDSIGSYLEEFGDRLPPQLRSEYQRVKRALG